MSDHSELIASLEVIVGKDNLLTAPGAVDLYRVEGLKPQAVAFPADREELAALVALGMAKGLKIVPWGGGTKMAAGNIPPRVDLVIGTGRLNKIVDYDIANLSVSVESGMTLAGLQEILAKEGSGFFLPLDPPYSEGPTLGGIVAANDSGPRRFLYGTARDHILGLKLVSPRGKQVSAGGKTVKNVAGYDTTKLMIGSWGTLGIITEITFKILPQPEKRRTILLDFTEPDRALAMAGKIVHSCYYPATVELLNPAAVRRLDCNPPEGYLLALSLEGVSEAVTRLENEIGKIGSEGGARRVIVVNETEHNLFWAAYRDLHRSLSKTCPGLVSLKINVPVSQGGSFLAWGENRAAALKMDSVWTVSVGNGIIHGHLLPGENARREGELTAAVKDLAAQALGKGGNVVVRQAPPEVKADLDVWGMPTGAGQIMRRIKGEFDPEGLMNYGRFFTPANGENGKVN